MIHNENGRSKAASIIEYVQTIDAAIDQQSALEPYSQPAMSLSNKMCFFIWYPLARAIHHGHHSNLPIAHKFFKTTDTVKKYQYRYKTNSRYFFCFRSDCSICIIYWL